MVEGQSPMPFKLELKETRRGCHILETTKRYDVILNSQIVGQLWFNVHGYLGYLPTPSGEKLALPESSISSYRREIARLNREGRA